MRDFDLNETGYTFQSKPLLFGGMAMEYYGLRKTGDDIDFVITETDYASLVRKYPHNTKNIFSDKGLVLGKYEFWTCICLFDYDSLSVGAIEKADYKIISLEKLLFLKALGINQVKNEVDLKLIVEKILNIQYGKDSLPE